MTEPSPESDFADRLLSWWRLHGRHDLPWQTDRSPYRVWVAEIMLQQTQVGTVIPYFKRFVASFPDLKSLATADLDEVLALWSGLGYYARARNLHKTAVRCMAEHSAALPADPEALEALPGIGRSTANAIVAQAHDKRAAILDGNVKRVLSRHAGIEGWPGRSAVLRRLWAEAEARLPANRAADYTQALMDLGATICTPRRPDCEHCPVAEDCVARRENRIDSLPGSRPKRTRPRHQTTLLIVENERGEILLERRPPAGIWGGLWTLPEAGNSADRPDGDLLAAPKPVRHQFTHFTLDIDFERVRIAAGSNIGEGEGWQWRRPETALELGLPQPVRRVIEGLDRCPPTLTGALS